MINKDDQISKFVATEFCIHAIVYNSLSDFISVSAIQVSYQFQTFIGYI